MTPELPRRSVFRFNLSDPVIEEALYDSISIRNFAKLSLTRDSIPDETTILNFRHLLEKHEIAANVHDVTQAHALPHGEEDMVRATGVLRSARRIGGATSSNTLPCA